MEPIDPRDPKPDAAGFGLSCVQQILLRVLHGQEMRLLRFGFFGVLSGLLYAIIVWLGATRLGAMPLIMNVFAYLLILPLNFFLNRNYTFKRGGSLGKQSLRFLIVHIFNISATSAAYVIVDMVHAPLLVGIVAALVMLPMIQFLALDRWVFGSARV